MSLIAAKPAHSRIYPISEGAVTIEFGNGISAGLMGKITAFDQLIRQQPFPGLLTTVPAYTTLTVFFDMMTVAEADMPGDTALNKVSGYLEALSQSKLKSGATESRTITIPVCYGGEFGPDIDLVAEVNSLTTQQVIDIHSSATYLVHMIGFLPGFAYLGGMPQTIAAPRKTSPRASVPAGAVGIAGLQTGVYPLQTPGGWQIIGHTPLKMFNITKQQPSLLKAGNKIVFKPVNLAQFDEYQ